MKPHDIEVAFKKFEVEHVQVVDVLQSSLLVLERARIATTAAATRLPTVYGYREHVEIGGLISYGANLDSGFHRAATYVYKILKGIPVTDLPVEFPTRLELVINLKTAKALGLDIPARLLARADEVIEYSIATGMSLLRCMSPELAPLRHADAPCECLLIGVDRKWSVHRQIAANDPPDIVASRDPHCVGTSCYPKCGHQEPTVKLYHPWLESAARLFLVR